MTYRIDFSSQAQAEADAAFVNFAQFTTPERARSWYQGLIKAISSLQEMPHRCTLARENAFFSQEIRQLLYRSGKTTYRILFTVLEDLSPLCYFSAIHLCRTTASQRSLRSVKRTSVLRI